MLILHDQAILLVCISRDLSKYHRDRLTTASVMVRAWHRLSRTGVSPVLPSVREQEGELESLPCGRPPNGTPVRPPVLDAVFVTTQRVGAGGGAGAGATRAADRGGAANGPPPTRWVLWAGHGGTAADLEGPRASVPPARPWPRRCPHRRSPPRGRPAARPRTVGALRASPPMESTVQPNGHVCTTCGAVTGSPNTEPKLRRSRLKLGLSWTSLVVGLFYGTPVFSQTYCTQSP